ncbi:MAG TPA: PEGA domain-containing protein, partial [Armatimonadota bacterium]|nr:PEGA domain-containing protein [Armatimonadota bacterium]
DKEGNVEIKASPSRTSVYVNGILYSEKGRARFNLPAGQWKIELRAPGYLPQTIDLNVEQGIRYSIERKLEKDRSVGRDGKPLKTEEL